MAELTQAQQDKLKQLLEHRYNELRWEIVGILNKSDDERYAALAGLVHDAGDESVADLLVDINLNTIDQLVQEINQVEQALMKIPRGVYGDCLDCGDTIPYERLEIEPHASRCVPCQKKFDREHAGLGEPSL